MFYIHDLTAIQSARGSIFCVVPTPCGWKLPTSRILISETSIYMAVTYIPRPRAPTTAAAAAAVKELDLKRELWG